MCDTLSSSATNHGDNIVPVALKPFNYVQVMLNRIISIAILDTI